MKEENSITTAFGLIDAIVLVVSASVAAGYAITKTPPSFWISSCAIQAIAFTVTVVKGRDCSHWPSTVFGVIELSYIFALLGILSSGGVSFESLAYMFFGLLFVHGILYLIAAKPYLSRRGFIKTKKT